MAPSLLIYEAHEWRNVDQEMGGMFHQSEDTKLISLAKDLQDQVKQNAYLLSCFFFF